MMREEFVERRRWIDTGEFLDLLAAKGIRARGLDVNHEMVEVCRARGLDVSEGDAGRTLRRRGRRGAWALQAGTRWRVG